MRLRIELPNIEIAGYDMKPGRLGRNWPKGKKCNHPKTREVTSSQGWGCPYDRIKTVCEQCGQTIAERRIN